MRKLLTKFNQPTLVIITTIFSILFTQLLLLIVYEILNVQIRSSEIIVGILAPLLVASTVTWYLFGLIKELDRLEKKMRALATYDQLTKLLTKRAFFEKAVNYFNIAKQEKHQFGILMVDLDNFKQLNDTFGHTAGDYVLKKFGETLSQNRRKTDLIGRFGGEEFIFFLWAINSLGIMQYTDNLHTILKKMKLQYNGNHIQFTISIGIAYYSSAHKTDDLMEIIQQADNALYLAKKTGRNKTVIYKD